MPVRFRVSTQAKTARIIVGPERPLELIVPAGTKLTEAQSFLIDKRPWIEEKIAKSKEIASRPARLGLAKPDKVWLHMQETPVVVREGVTGAQLDGWRLLLGARAGEDAIDRWYRRQARKEVLTSVDREAKRLNLAYQSFAIRDPKTRWGSCSRRRNLSFSWRLMIAPVEVLDYVVVHELCHLQEPNHSKAFWRLLEAVMPGWQEHDRWLREHGRELREWRPVLARDI